MCLWMGVSIDKSPSLFLKGPSVSALACGLSMGYHTVSELSKYIAENWSPLYRLLVQNIASGELHSI